MAKALIVGQAALVHDYAHAELLELADVLATALVWIAQSATSPLSAQEAGILLARIDRLRER